MSLRAFHIVFLFSTILLFTYLSYWNYTQWGLYQEDVSLVYLGASLVTGLIVIFYGMKFYNKTKGLNG